MIATVIQAANEKALTNGSTWGKAHMAAWTAPRRAETAIRDMVVALANYADTHEAAYHSPIGADGVLGPAWLHLLAAVRELLTGECGRLDCGTVDRMLADMARAAGFDANELKEHGI